VERSRRTLVDAYADCGELLASPELAARWDEESALRDFTVRGLAGHLVRAGEVVLEYLAREEPHEAPVQAPDYYVSVIARRSDDDDREVRSRGEANALGGPAGLSAKHARAVARLERALDEEPEGRVVRVFGGLVMRLDDYLATRLVEVLVHADDLAASLGLEPPPLERGAADVAIDHLVAVARRAHGDRAVLLALTRRERDAVQALRVF
jgi:uncharacterized protein (TIGR03083 family)